MLLQVIQQEAVNSGRLQGDLMTISTFYEIHLADLSGAPRTIRVVGVNFIMHIPEGRLPEDLEKKFLGESFPTGRSQLVQVVGHCESADWDEQHKNLCPR